jgi:hypothetical protein
MFACPDPYMYGGTRNNEKEKSDHNTLRLRLLWLRIWIRSNLVDFWAWSDPGYNLLDRIAVQFWENWQKSLRTYYILRYKRVAAVLLV